MINACLLRRRLLALAALFALAGCGTSSAPPPRLYQLRVDAPGTPAAAASALDTWELVGTVRVPDYLDRTTIVVASGDAELLVLDGNRWAEPLRDSVPRLLVHDLARLRGADRIWAAPAPPGAVINRRLRVELLSLQAGADRAAVALQARWWFIDPQGQAPPTTGSASLSVPTGGPGIDAIVRAHRTALWQLAERIAAPVPPVTPAAPG